MTEEDKPLEIELSPSSTLCAGMVAAYVCRSIAHRAGTYAPGIHEWVFRALREKRYGRNLDGVNQWFAHQSAEMFRLGYRISARRVAFRTPMIEKWVGRGDGYRAALLTTDGKRFHQELATENPHAVGLVTPLAALSKKAPAKKAPAIELIDPWPGKPAKRPPDAALEPAHRSRKYGTILVFWTGHS